VGTPKGIRKPVSAEVLRQTSLLMNYARIIALNVGIQRNKIRNSYTTESYIVGVQDINEHDVTVKYAMRFAANGNVLFMDFTYPSQYLNMTDEAIFTAERELQEQRRQGAVPLEGTDSERNTRYEHYLELKREFHGGHD
jgi:hypothetical protein